MSINIPEKKHGNAIISASNGTAYFSGEIDDFDPGLFLKPFFNTLQTQITGHIRLDFSKLEFLNSSGIKQIVSFVMNKDESTKVTFLTDKNKTWQKTSLEVIQSLDEKTIAIEEINTN